MFQYWIVIAAAINSEGKEIHHEAAYKIPNVPPKDGSRNLEKKALNEPLTGIALIIHPKH